MSELLEDAYKARGLDVASEECQQLETVYWAQPG